MRRHAGPERGNTFSGRVDLVGDSRERPVYFSGGTVVAAMQLAAEDESHTHAGADREEREVVDSSSDPGPALADRSEVDVVLERHCDAEALLHVHAERSAFEPWNVRRRQLQRSLGGVDHAGHAEHDSVDAVGRQRGTCDQRLLECGDRVQCAVRIRAAQLEVLPRAHFAAQIADSPSQEARAQVEADHEGGLGYRLEEQSSVAGAARAAAGLAHETRVHQGLERERDGRLRDPGAA